MLHGPVPALQPSCCSVPQVQQHETSRQAIGTSAATGAAAQCSPDSSCVCTCRSRRGSASSAAVSISLPASSSLSVSSSEPVNSSEPVSSSAPVSPGTNGDNWLDVGAACSRSRLPGVVSCRPGSFCCCSCVDGTPVGGSDTFTYTDPEGPEPPGDVSISVLGNDVSPDGTAVSIVPGSVVSLTPGVTVTSVDESAGIITVNIPDDIPSVELLYNVVNSNGQLGTAPVSVVGTPSNTYPKGQCLQGSLCSDSKSPRSPIQCQNKKNLKCSVQQSATCAALKFPKPKSSDTYCMGNFQADCDAQSNAGCDRCAIYQVMQDCRKKTQPFPTPSQNPTEPCRYHSTTGHYVIVKSRTRDSSQTGQAADPEKGTNICLMKEHYILMPTAACTGVDDNRQHCTGPQVTYWDGAVRHGFRSGAGDLGFGTGNWAVMINEPDERGQHQMHIHVAPLAPVSSTNILFNAKGNSNIETDTSKQPTVITTANGHEVAAYFFKDNNTPPDVTKVDVFQTAADIHGKYVKTKSLSYNDVAYGVALIPKGGGFIVAATYGFADVQVMDTTFTNTPPKTFCQAACEPFK